MRIDLDLKQLLAAELCAIMAGWDQYHFASLLRMHQPQVSALRQGRVAGFSSDRLLRLIASSGYDLEIVLREMPQRFAQPRVEPTVAVRRYDRHGRLVERPAAGPVKRVRRWSGEFAASTVESMAREPPRRHEPLNNNSDIDEE